MWRPAEFWQTANGGGFKIAFLPTTYFGTNARTLLITEIQTKQKHLISGKPIIFRTHTYTKTMSA